jgi:membrane protein required for colicin V production
MGILDWLILIILMFTLVWGWRKGIIAMVLQLAGVVLVFFLIAHYFPLVKHGLMVKLHLGSLLSSILGVILIVALIALIVQIIRLIMEKTMQMMHVSFLNSAIGALIGFLAGLILIVILSLLVELVPSFRRPLENSERHKVYAAVRVVRSEIYSAFKLQKKIADTPKRLLEKDTPAED